jgi:hypothetical protein
MLARRLKAIQNWMVGICSSTSIHSMLLRELSRWYLAQAAVPSGVVVVGAPRKDARPGLWHGIQPMFVQALVTKLAIEALDVVVLHGPSWLNQDVEHAGNVQGVLEHGAPLVKGGLAKAAAAESLDGQACFRLLEEPDDLLIGQSCGQHIRHSPKFADQLPLPWYGCEGAGQWVYLIYTWIW